MAITESYEGWRSTFYLRPVARSSALISRTADLMAWRTVHPFFRLIHSSLISYFLGISFETSNRPNCTKSPLARRIAGYRIAEDQSAGRSAYGPQHINKRK